VSRAELEARDWELGALAADSQLLASHPEFLTPRSRVRMRWYLALGAVVVLAGALAVWLMLLPAHVMADVTHYKYWARLVAFAGVAGAYSGQYPETAAIYPPLTMYGYWLAGLVYQGLVDPTFEMGRALGSRALTVLVKLVAVVPHLVGIVAIFALLVRRHGPRVALLAAAAYGLNPAALFDLAYWGQPDSVHALFLVLAIWCFEEDRPLPGWAAVGLAAATKPQAWALLPFLAYVSLRRFGLVRSAAGGATAAVAGLLVCLPYLLAGTLEQLLTLPRLIAETMPVVTANAHNLWWLVTDAKSDFVFDADPLLGPLTYRQVAVLLTLAILAYGLWRTDPHARRGGLFAMAAYLAFGWFLVTTRAHENHPFFVLPLLVMAAPRSRFLAGAFLVLSITLFFNMTFHDFSLGPLRESLLPPDLWVRLQLLNAGVNVLLFLVWSARIAPRSYSPQLERRPAPRA
jgi:hypothetical protein